MGIAVSQKQKQRPVPAQPPIADFGAFYVAVLDPKEWLSFADHPERRDVSRHSKKAHWEFLRRANGPMVEALRTVVGAEFNGVFYKVDGHTRSHLWQEGSLPLPASLLVTIYRCNSASELHEIYNAFDSQFAVEERYESVLGAFRAHGLNLTSKRLRDGMVVDAFYIALTGVARSNLKVTDGCNELDLYKAVGYFKEELKLLDSARPRAEVFHGGVVAAALLGLSIRPQGIEFFKALSKSGRRQAATTKSANGKRDPVAALLLYLAELKQSRSGWIKRSQEELCARTLRAFFAHCRGADAAEFWFDDVPTAEDVDPIIQTVRKIKGADVALIL